MKWLGLLALALYGVVAGYKVYRGLSEEMLWSCHLATAVIGVGLLAGWASWVTVGVLWLVIGVPLWLLDLAAGGEFTPPSVLTHVGGLAVGLVGLRQLGVPTGSWWKALLALAVLQQLCRWITPAPANVNVAFAVWAGWERWFPSFRVYLVFLFVVLGIVFFAAESLLRRLVAS